MIHSFVLLAFASLAASRALLQWLVTCFNFTLDADFTTLLMTKNQWFLWTMASAQAVENLKFFSSSKSTEFKNIFPWNISQMIINTVPSSTRIIISYGIKQSIPFQFDRKSMETETATWSELPNWGKAIVEQVLALEEIDKYKRAGLWESQSGIRKVNHLSKVIWEQQSSPGLPVPFE